MKHKMTLFIENKELTSVLRAWDLFHDKKYLVELIDIEFETKAEVNEAYFMNFINKSTDSDMRILAIEYMNNLFSHPEVVEISDGLHSVFMRPLKNPPEE